jgi:hypothetical protein
MKSITPSILLALWITLFPAPLSSAQDTGDKTVKVRFRVFGWDDAPSDLNYSQRAKDSSMLVIQDNRSIFYDYTGPALITFYRIKTDSEGKPIRETAAQADLSKAGPWPLILLAKSPQKPGRYDARVLRDDLKSFPSGTYVFSNFSAIPLTGSLGGRIFDLPPGGEQLIAPKTSDDSTTLFAALVKMEGSQKMPVYTNNWAVHPARRTRVLIKASTESPSGLVAVRVVESTVFPPVKEDGITTAD